MHWFALAFLGGILFVQQLATLPSLWWALLLAPFGLLILTIPRFLPPLSFVGGVFWATVQAGAILQDQLPQALEGKDLRIDGVVASIPRRTDYGARFELEVDRAFHNGQVVQVPGKILLNAYRVQRYPRAGERWRFLVRLKRPHGFQNPGGFDYEGHLFRKRIGAKGYVRAAEFLDSESVRHALGQFRQRLGERITAFLPDSPQAGILVALANGDRSGLTQEQWRVLRGTGTNHLMAISGLHIGLVAGLVFFFFRWLWSLPGTTVLVWPAPKAAAVAALLAATSYAALAGFTVPTQRALVMLGVVLGGVLFQRRLRPTLVLGLALLAVLLFDPLAVMGPGFWLSFAAVAVIFATASGRSGSNHRLLRLGRIQWVLAIGLFPLTLLLFQQASLSAPVANLVAVPLFGFLVVPLTLAGVVALHLLPDVLAQGLLQLAAWLVAQLWLLLQWFADFKQGLWVQSVSSGWTVAAALVGIALLLAPRGWPGRWTGVAWLLPLFFVRPPGPAFGEMQFTLLDVDQGLAAVVRTKNHVLVYDTGPRFGRFFDTGRAVVVPYLRYQGIDRIDLLMISHGDNDHLGGAHSVIAAMPVDKLSSSVPERLTGASACIAGQRWLWDGVEFTVLSPLAGKSGSSNNASCVLLVTSRHGAVLLPGDIEKETELVLVQQYGAGLAAEILVVPHHGSKTSSTAAFIRHVDPAFALLPVGYRNRYRHPHKKVVARYRDHGARLLASPRAGAISFHLQAGGPAFVSWREHTRRYWFSF